MKYLNNLSFKKMFLVFVVGLFSRFLIDLFCYSEFFKEYGVIITVVSTCLFSVVSDLSYTDFNSGLLRNIFKVLLEKEFGSKERMVCVYDGSLSKFRLNTPEDKDFLSCSSNSSNGDGSNGEGSNGEGSNGEGSNGEGSNRESSNRESPNGSVEGSTYSSGGSTGFSHNSLEAYGTRNRSVRDKVKEYLRTLDLNTDHPESSTSDHLASPTTDHPVSPTSDYLASPTWDRGRSISPGKSIASYDSVPCLGSPNSDGSTDSVASHIPVMVRHTVIGHFWGGSIIHTNVTPNPRYVDPDWFTQDRKARVHFTEREKRYLDQSVDRSNNTNSSEVVKVEDKSKQPEFSLKRKRS